MSDESPRSSSQKAEGENAKSEEPSADVRPSAIAALVKMNAKLEQVKSKVEEIPALKNLIEGFQELLDAIDERMARMNNQIEQTLDGMEQIYNKQGDIIRQLEEANQLNRQRRSPSPGPSNRRMFDSRACAFCDGDHYACDCTVYTRLMERKRRIARNRCERCLLLANHLTTSCKRETICFYCKTAGREEEIKNIIARFVLTNSKCNFSPFNS